MDMLEELKLFRQSYHFDNELYHEWIQLVVKYGNSNRLRKLGLHVGSRESLNVICEKFPHLVVFFINQHYTQAGIKLFSLAKLKQLQTLVFHVENIDDGD